MTDRQFSVLIVGAGPIGLVAANLLGMAGISTRLIERNAGLSDLPRAISIDDEGLRICQALGLHAEIVEHVRLNVGAEYLSRERLLVRVAPLKQSSGYPLISTFDQPRFEAALLAGVRRFPCVEVCFGQTLESFVQSGESVQATIRNATGELEEVSSAYLLACDGGKSSVRKSLGLTLRGRTFPQRWLVVDALCSEPLIDNHITFFCNPARPAVSVPAPGKGWRWEFMLFPGEQESWFLSAINLRNLLQQLGETRETRILRQSIYTFHAACASSFADRRVFLLGDAAHLLPPFGGQGMNCGLRDAHNLVWKLALVLHKQATPALLATYQQERLPDARQMIRLSAFLGRIVMPTSRPLAFARDSILRLLLLVPSVATALQEMRVKPAAFYRRGLRLTDGSRLSASYAGRLLPQPTVQTPAGDLLLLDELLGTGFALLRLYADARKAFVPLQSDLWQKLNLRYLCLIPANETFPVMDQPLPIALDKNQQFADFLRGRQDLFVLVRPDRYICGVFRVDREQVFTKKLQQQLFARNGDKTYAR